MQPKNRQGIPLLKAGELAERLAAVDPEADVVLMVPSQSGIVNTVFVDGYPGQEHGVMMLALDLPL